MQSGQYLELESMDDCVLYDERGELLSRFQPQVDRLPTLAEGENTLRFDLRTAAGPQARAEVTVISLGAAVWQPPGRRGHRLAADSIASTMFLAARHPARRPRQRLDDCPQGRHAPRTPRRRPPLLEIEIAFVPATPEKPANAGPAAAVWTTPTLTVGDRSVRFPVRLTAGQRLVCRDQTTWRVFNADGAEAASGRLPTPFRRWPPERTGQAGFPVRPPRASALS